MLLYYFYIYTNYNMIYNIFQILIYSVNYHYEWLMKYMYIILLIYNLFALL